MPNSAFSARVSFLSRPKTLLSSSMNPSKEATSLESSGGCVCGSMSIRRWGIGEGWG